MGMSTQKNDLTGRTALVTGATAGIGRAVARQLAARGADVVVHGRDAGRGAEVVREIGGRARFVGADLTDADEVGRLAAAAGDVDILVNNAAVSDTARIADLTLADLNRVMTVNFTFPLLLIRDATPLLRDHGRIINISTVNTVLPGPGLALYCASKAALEQITAVAARELGPRGITVNTVSPGATDTDMLRGANSPEALAYFAGANALQRLGEPDDVAAVVAMLAGPDARWITGQNIRASGGLVV